MSAGAVQITLKQERLAAALLDPAVKTKTEAMLRAGYAPSTAMTQQGRASGSVGAGTALERRRKQQRDKARGLRALAERLLEGGERRISKLEEELSPAEQIAAGANLMKLSHQMGETGPDVREAREHFEQWKQRLMRRCFRAGFRAAIEGRDPLHLVLSPSVTEHCEQEPLRDNEPKLTDGPLSDAAGRKSLCTTERAEPHPPTKDGTDVGA